jgi:GntR family transcriptional regulator
VAYRNLDFTHRLRLGEHDDLRPVSRGAERQQIFQPIFGRDVIEPDGPDKSVWRGQRLFEEPQSCLARCLLCRQTDAIFQIKHGPVGADGWALPEAIRPVCRREEKISRQSKMLHFAAPIICISGHLYIRTNNWSRACTDNRTALDEAMVLDSVRGDSPLFRRISSTLADAIGRGDYPVGGPLPTESTLMRMFGTSRFTIREALVELRSRGLIASRRGVGSVVLRAVPQEAAFREEYESVDEFLAGIVQAPLTTLEVTDVVADVSLASQLRCEEGRQFIMLRGERRRWGHPEEPPIALVWAYVNATYGLIRPRLSNLTESLAGTAEKVLNVRVQRIVQELRPTALDAEAATSLVAPVGSSAMLVWRWYYLDNDDLLIISRSVYPHERMVFRTELTRSEPPPRNA